MLNEAKTTSTEGFIIKMERSCCSMKEQCLPKQTFYSQLEEGKGKKELDNNMEMMP